MVEQHAPELAYRMSAPRSPRQEMLRQVKKNFHAYIFISPFFILFMIFFLYPTIKSFSLSFYEWESFNTITFVGWKNYIKLSSDTLFMETVKNSAVIMVLTLIPQMFFAIIIAVALNSRLIRARGLWRATYFSPIVLSPVVVGIVFALIFDQRYGFLNYLLSFIGVGQINWLNSAQFSKLSVSLLTTWRWTGWNMVIILAGLQSIPEELYDAAKVDGASEMQSFRFVTLPLLRPIISYLIMLGIIDGLRLFAEPNVLTKGGPGSASETMIMYLYNQAFLFFNFGYASAVAVVIFLALILIAVFTWRFLRRGEE